MISYETRKQNWVNAVNLLARTKPLTAEVVMSFVYAAMSVTRQGSGLSSQDLETAIIEAFKND